MVTNHLLSPGSPSSKKNPTETPKPRKKEEMQLQMALWASAEACAAEAAAASASMVPCTGNPKQPMGSKTRKKKQLRNTTFPKNSIAPEKNSWKMSLLLGFRPIFRCELAVSFLG